MTRNIKLVIEYDGTRYAGWQIQRGRPTVQQQIVDAIHRVTNEKVTLYGASRTDAGVHAVGQVANFHTRSKILTERFPHAINFYLPEDIAVRSAEEVPAEFHAQFDARGKTYRYTVLNAWTPRPLVRTTTYHVRGPLEVSLMRRAARAFIGRHDFRAFGTEAGRRKTTVRTVRHFKIWRDGELLFFEVNGDGFLYNMVRAMVGTLLRVGQGKLPPREVARILREADRVSVGPIVPPHGLCLMEVQY